MSADTTNEALLHRREQTAERTRAYRERIAQQSEAAESVVPREEDVAGSEAVTRGRGRPSSTVTDTRAIGAG